MSTVLIIIWFWPGMNLIHNILYIIINCIFAIGHSMGVGIRYAFYAFLFINIKVKCV